MNVWIAAEQAAGDALNAMLLLSPGVQVRQGDVMAPEPLEQSVTAIARAADTLGEFPDTAEQVSRLRDIAFRYRRNRPTDQQFTRDLRVVRVIQNEVFARMMMEQRRGQSQST